MKKLIDIILGVILLLAGVVILLGPVIGFSFDGSVDGLVLIGLGWLVIRTQIPDTI